MGVGVGVMCVKCNGVIVTWNGSGDDVKDQKHVRKGLRWDVS